MNESIPAPAPVEPTAPAYKDRSVGLAIFGSLTILLGCLAGLFVPMMFFGQVMAARTGQPTASLATLVPGMCIYGGLAIALVWLGIGSILARRWARVLLLIFSWSWLAVGIITMIIMAIVMPKLMANLPSPSGGMSDHPAPQMPLAAVLTGMFLFLGVIFILLPAIWTFFYSSRHVKATCQARDAVTRWTDACPPPVLAVSLWLLFSVPMMLLMPLVAHGVMPFFGTFLTGAAGMILSLAIAVLWCYAAWLMYRLKPLGWWLVLVAMCIFLVSGLMTFARHDILEMYQLMGYPQAQIDQIQKTGLLTGHRMSWIMAGSAVPFLVYLLFVKRYFRANASPN